jgi:hypothetical protein
MGFDTSHHPVDEALARRALDHVLEGAPIDDLIAEGVRIAKVGFRANAWGLGLTRVEGVAGFDAHLHVWGRPFFITKDEGIGASIDRYLGASVEEVDAIAEEMIAHLDPALVGRVTPDPGGTLPADAALATQIGGTLGLLRRAWEGVESNAAIELPSGDRAPARELLEREVPFAVLRFVADLRPGWMDRGYVWPTHLLAEAKVGGGDGFGPPTPLLGAIGEHPALRCFAPPTITENYMVGGYVGPESVSSVRAAVEAERATLEAVYDDGGVNEPMRTSVRKLREALADADERGFAFCEATEIYSGFSGIMN